MNPIKLTLSFCAVAGGLLLSGCSKHQDTKASPENSSTVDNPAAAASADSAEMKIKWQIGQKFAW